MHQSKITLIFLIVAALVTLLFYFGKMGNLGFFNLSDNVQDWGSFGSYLGGVLAPVTAFAASFLIYQNLKLDSYHKRLEIVRSSIGRFDEQLFSKINTPFNNSILGDKFNGKPYLNVLYARTNGEIESSEIDTLLLGTLQDIAIMCTSVQKYLILLNQFEKDPVSSEWIVETERFYWIQKYSPICKRIIKTIGEDKIKNKLRHHQWDSLKNIMVI